MANPTPETAPWGQPAPIIVGAGEVLWDVFSHGEHFGGATANVAVHAAALGAEALMISAVGADTRGLVALHRMVRFHVDTSAVARLTDYPTGVVRVSVDANGVPSYDIEGGAWDWIPWSSEAERAAKRADAICFGSLAQRSTRSRSTIRRAVAATRPTAWRLFDVNLRQNYYDAAVLTKSLELANAVKLNEEELPVVARLCELPSGPPVEQLRALCERFKLRLAALTQGAKGSVLVSAREMWECPAPKTNVVDTVGAGDAFTAALLVGMLAGESMEVVNSRANAIAAYVCSQPGATPALPASL